MMFCYKCGKKVRKTSVFCPSCGYKLHKEKKEKKIKEREPVMKVVVEKSRNTGLKVFVFLLIVGGLIGYFIYASEQHSTGGLRDIIKGVKAPRLYVGNVDGDFEFSLSQGCYAIIRGVLYNRGNADAYSSYVECNAYRSSGGLLGTGTTNVGTVYANSQKSFTMNFDFGCISTFSEENARSDCKADCSNC